MVSVRQAVATALNAARGGAASDARLRRASTGALCALVSVTWSAHAFAQQAQPQQAPSTPTQSQNATQPQALEEVTVTGSRIKRTTDFNTPTPTTVIDATAMENAGVVNVGQALAMTPANISAYTPATTGDSPFFIGAYIPDLRGLNPEFGTRTLTLIDSRRAVPTNTAGSFDLNLIPQILVQRIDTVTGGASAAYGSGAEAGVINIILDNKLEGGKINGDLYETSHSDAKDHHIGAAWGHGFANNRIHFVIGGEFEKQDGLGCQDVRSWCGEDRALSQTGWGPVAGTYNGIYGPGTSAGVTSGTTSTNGVFVPEYGIAGYNGNIAYQLQNYALQQLTLGGAGLTTFDQGIYQPGLMPGADCANPSACGIFPGGLFGQTQNGQGIPVYQYNTLMTPVSRGVITAMLSGELTDKINFKADFNWGKTESSQLDYPGVTESTPVYGTAGYQQACPAGTIGPYGGTCYNSATFAPAGPPTNTLVTGLNGNPYLSPAQWQTLAQTYGGYNAYTNGVYTFNKDLTSLVDPTQAFSTDLKRASISFDGQIGQSSWSWDAYGTYGQSNHEQVQHNLKSNAYSMATDVIEGPNGPECRVSQPGGVATAVAQDVAAGYFPSYVAGYLATLGSAAAGSWPGFLQLLANGCQPINIFGNQPLSAAALDYSTGSLDERSRYTQTVVSGDLSGDFFKGIGAGAFSIAVGAEWRQEVLHNYEVNCAATDYQCAVQLIDYLGQYGNPYGGQVTVDEGYLETNLPLAKNLPFAHLLELDLAARESHYDTARINLAGDALTNPDNPNYLPSQFASLGFEGNESKTNLTTWKASLLWEPLTGLRFRGSQSRDMRAPAFEELFHEFTSEPAAGLFGGYCNLADTLPCYEYDSGNINLKPEKSDTTTLGLVFTPPQVQGLQLSADFFHIHINDAIYQNTDESGIVESACASNPSSPYCGQIEFLPNEFTNGSPALVELPGSPAPGPGQIASYSANSYAYACSPAATGSYSATSQGGALNCSGLSTLSGAQAYAHGASNVASLLSTSFNGAWFDVRGVDFSLNYLQLLPDGSSLSLRSLSTWTNHQEYQVYQGGPVYSLLGQTGEFASFGAEEQPAPRWRGNVYITWQKGGFSLTPNMSWVGHGTINNLLVSPADGALYQAYLAGFPHATSSLAPGEAPFADSALQQQWKAQGYSGALAGANYVPSYFLFGLNVAYDFQGIPGVKDLSVYTQVNNLLNREPPVTGRYYEGIGGTNPALFDTLGLAYRVGFRLTF